MYKARRGCPRPVGTCAWQISTCVINVPEKALCYSGYRSETMKNAYKAAIKSPFQVPRNYHSSLEKHRKFFQLPGERQ